MDLLDNAAMAAFYALAHERDPALEHIGALYADGERIARTPTVTSGRSGTVNGSLRVPAGMLRALFHNHPPTGERDSYRERFSDDDKAQARRLGVPSYIDVGGKVMRFDPAKNETTEVLAEFPVEEMRAYIMRNLLHREPDDPRGLYR